MKPFDELLRQRRSIRQYDAQKNVSKECIEKLLAAAIEAPSWKNKQTSRYHVVMSPEIRSRLKECLALQNQISIADAPVLIVTTFVKGIVGFERDGTPTNELADGWGAYDLGLQNSILLLKATELGLDSIVLGLRDADAIRDLLHIQDDEVIVSVIGVGYRSKDFIRPKRKEISEIVTYY